MCIRFAIAAMVAAAVTLCPSGATAQSWSFPGLANDEFKAIQPGGPPPRRDLTGAWDPGGAGIAGGDGYFNGRQMAPLTPLGKEMLSRNRPGHGPESAKVFEGNDPLTTRGDPSGFPRILNYEFRPTRIVQIPGAVLMMYSFNQTWRIIWTDGRPLPEDPDPRWFGYSVGRWVDDFNFVVDTVGMTDRTWVDSGGYPHSEALRVQERYTRTSANVIELTVTINDPQVYTKPWTSRDRLPLKRLPDNTDFLEQIYAASEVTGFKEDVATKAKTE